MSNIDTNIICNKVHRYITDRKWNDYAPTTMEMQEVYNKNKKYFNI